MTMDWFSKDFWLKIIAFVLAIIVWAYAREDLDNIPGYAPQGSYNRQIPAETLQR